MRTIPKAYPRRHAEPERLPYAATALLAVSAWVLVAMLAWAGMRIGGLL